MGFLRHFEELHGILKRSLGRDNDLELMLLRVSAASDILGFEIREEEESDWTQREWNLDPPQGFRLGITTHHNGMILSGSSLLGITTLHNASIDDEQSQNVVAGIAETALFLASDESVYVSGQNLVPNMKGKCKMVSDLSGEAKLKALLMVGLVMASKVYCEELELGFYRQTCPSAERIVRDAVEKGVAINPGMAAGLIRLHFHDCIVLSHESLCSKRTISVSDRFRLLQMVSESDGRVRTRKLDPLVDAEDDGLELLQILSEQDTVRCVSKDDGPPRGWIGCDASILFDKTPQNPDFERDRPGNPLLRGFEIIDDAKSQLESQCPQTVSCADILAFAARDSVATVGQFTYAVPGGRRDSLISHGAKVADNLPFPTTDIGFLKQHFEERGLSLRDMVALSGAHSIGRTACAEFSDRLFFFNGVDQNSTDPTLDPKFAAFLKEKCPLGSGFDKTADLDNVTTNRLDVQYFENLKRNLGVLSSDQALASDSLTAAIVSRYQKNRVVWMRDFAAAMVKMGKLQVLTGTQGEIRKKCHFRN
ncbi:Peroxidase 5, partial [Cucurbita argyrosperma subsp. argyrosperma]